MTQEFDPLFNEKEGLVSLSESDGVSDFRAQLAVLPPVALSWLHEFEEANGHRDGAHLWRDLHGKSGLRATKQVGGLDWPGIVHVPSALMEKELGKKVIHLPARWTRTLPAHSHAPLLSALTAWELERGVYRLTPRTSLLVAHCNTIAPLSPSIFESMPSQGLYLDLFSSSMDGDVGNCHVLQGGPLWDDAWPMGFFANVDQPKKGQLNLVLTMDWQTHLDVHRIPLNGKTIDELTGNLLIQARQQSTVSRSWAETEVRETAALWNLCISALLMTCINRHRMKAFPALAEDAFQSTRQPWIVWEVGHGIETQIEAEMQRHEFLGRNPMLVGHWYKPADKSTVNLQFAAGCQLNWDVLEKRHGKANLKSKSSS